jgi:hypothetical protein
MDLTLQISQPSCPHDQEQDCRADRPETHSDPGSGVPGTCGLFAGVQGSEQDGGRTSRSSISGRCGTQRASVVVVDVSVKLISGQCRIY